MDPRLPPRSNLRFFKTRAKALLKAHAQKDPKCLDVLKYLRGFSNATAMEVFSTEIALHDVQYALALQKGFKSWNDLRKAIIVAGSTPKPNEIDNEGEDKMTNDTSLVMMTVVQRPKRKLMFLRSKKAHDYWSYCEERGCDWEKLFNSFEGKFDTAALLSLPPILQKEGFSPIASGIEVPFDYNETAPESCEIADLDPCEMLYFQSEAFVKEEDYGIAIGYVEKAIAKYDSKHYGLEYALELAPKFNFGAGPANGAKQALPVRRIG